MSGFVTELKVYEKDKTIFDTNMKYIIPLYQRAFAWEDKQLIQLIEDINDVSPDSNYYIGSLIVSKQGDKYEVVDGQQRLTSLFLLLNCLGVEVQNTLTFACREKSNYTLQNVRELLEEDENRSKLDMDKVEAGLQRGIKILTEELRKQNINEDSFLKKLSRVIIYRIEVPEHTDLNRYFEIMNTRGEQLEQHDILKATLMSYLEKDSDKRVFATIWDACSDMTGYVQMHFISKGNEIRENIFGNRWNDLPSSNWRDYRRAMDVRRKEEAGHNIRKIVKVDFAIDDDEGYLDGDVRVRFESVIEFSYFLLHTLKILIELKGIEHKRPNVKIIDDMLDDKKLLDSFKGVVNNGCIKTGSIADDKDKFAKDFVVCLLRTRFLFDKYIVKREYTNDSADGEWSLKSLYVSGQQSKKKPYYRNTRCIRSGGWTRNNEKENRRNIMLQSALRVSYTSPKVMHWITELLLWLSEDDCYNTGDDIEYFSEIVEDYARNAVVNDFFEVCEDEVYDMGVDTPHIVFNYLDFLIWDDNRGNRKYADFEFEFRNSVEHWYPQHPLEGTFEEWKDGVDQFGNLCIIQRNVNSKFSNMSPEAKKSTFKNMIAKGSLKLRLMSELTEKRGEKSASLRWKESLYKQHEDEMIEMLKTACGIE